MDKNYVGLKNAMDSSQSIKCPLMSLY